MRPLSIPPFAWRCGSTALAANTFGTYLEEGRVCYLFLSRGFRSFVPMINVMVFLLNES